MKNLKELHSEYQRKIMRNNLIVIIGTFIIEIIFFFLMNAFGDTKRQLKEYLLMFVLLPTTINLFCWVISMKFLKKKPNDVLPVINLMQIFCVIIIIHHIFPIVYSLMIIPIFMAMVRAKERFLTTIYTSSLVFITISYLFILLFFRNDLPVDFLYNAILSYGFMTFTYIITLRMIRYETEKENIIKNYLKQNQILKEKINIDGLTGLYNFNKLQKSTDKLLSESNFVYCMIDIDNFKQVNDTYGHEFGNVVLENLAAYMKELEENKKITAYRYGGEEFGILFDKYKIEDAAKVVNELRIKFSQIKYFNEKIFFTFSAGLANSTNLTQSTEIFQIADEKLYLAKSNGKNKVVY